MNITEALKIDIAHVGDLVRTSGGDIGRISGLANYKNALFHRLITVPGSLVHRPNYGVGLPMYQNSPMSFGIQQTLAAKIREQFLRDPRTEAVSSISISNDTDIPGQILIRVFVKPIGYTEQEMIFTPFNEGL